LAENAEAGTAAATGHGAACVPGAIGLAQTSTSGESCAISHARLQQPNQKHGDRIGHPRAALDAAAVRDAYRRWAGVYDEVFGGVSGAGRKRAVAMVNRLPGTKVLEVGVGTGLALPLYSLQKQVVGIDLSRDMLRRARDRVATDRLRNVAGLVEMDAESMAFQDGSFDIAVAMFTATVVPDARRLYREMRRVVRPGGELLFVNHFAASGGVRWWAERTLAPLSRVLGWHPDFALTDLLDDPLAVAETIECPPFGLFTLVRVPNPALA
jgi:phosphatidylethanolamine/phosphatidyl-N-methylethanolamine N-methyltransferase